MLIINQEVNETALEEWKEYRKAMKKPLSELALKKNIKLLIKYDFDTQQGIIDRSIQNDWRGLFEPSVQEKQESFIDRHSDRSWAN